MPIELNENEQRQVNELSAAIDNSIVVPLTHSQRCTLLDLLAKKWNISTRVSHTIDLIRALILLQQFHKQHNAGFPDGKCFCNLCLQVKNLREKNEESLGYILKDHV